MTYSAASTPAPALPAPAAGQQQLQGQLHSSFSPCTLVHLVQERTKAGELYCLPEVNGFFEDKEHYNTIK
jgi:hypothetical protein